MAEVGLKRELNLFNVTVAGVGIILGAGIYALIGVIAGYSGNAVWLAFLISAIVAGFTGLSYAELSSIFKGDAGEYDYCKSAFGEKIAIAIAYMIIFTGIVSAATVSLGFAGYISRLIGIEYLLGAIILIFLMSFINYYGISESNKFNMLATFLEFSGLLFIIILGVKYFGSVNLLEMPKGFGSVFQAAALAFFAYMGFETIVKLREETKNPDRTIPMALLLSIIITAIVYILVSISAVSVLNYNELAKSKSPLADVAKLSLGNYAFILIAIIALFSTSNTVLLTLLTTSRMIYGIAKEGAMPKIFAKVHRLRRTPHISVWLTGFAVFLFALIGNIELVANITTLFLFLTFALINLSNIILRYKLKVERPFKAPLNIGNFPVISFLGILTSLFLFIFSFINLFL